MLTTPARQPKGWPGHEVYPGVYVGDLTCALDLKQLQERGITHIITATNRMKPMHVKDLHYLVLDFPDSADQNMVDAFHDAHSFIDEATGAGGKVLVHWYEGEGREERGWPEGLPRSLTAPTTA